ncbi:hypothetical protein C8R47DRAFT_1215213 [Mycena vitilis]|nr:hypothetical protein C8R47DRAFT_1215213 [Mycena vitilis]
MLLLHLLYVALLPLLVASRDDGQESSADVLNSKDGDTPCEMRDTFPTTCTTKLPARDADDDDDNNGTSFSQLTPTPCICTNVYFNLWSACVYAQTQLANTTLPVLSSLEQKCAQASINVMTKQPQADAPYPGWAFMALPASNSSFDLAAAIETASQSNKWTIIQIVLPILVGLAIGILIIVGYIIYRRRQRTNRQRPWMQTTGNRPRFQFPSISSRHNKVRELNRSSSWSIDEREEDLGEYQFVSYPASLQGSQVTGHVRLSPSSTRSVPGPPMLEIPANKATPVRTWPGKSLWKGPLQSALQLGEAIPRPWRSTKRVAVKTVPSYSKFRVDASDSDSPLSQRTHVGSLLDRPGRSRTNLHNETIFEGQDEQ